MDSITLKNVLDQGEKLAAEHGGIMKAITVTTTEAAQLQRQLADAECRASEAEAGAALGSAGMVESARRTLDTVRDRYATIGLRLEGLRSKLIDSRREKSLMDTLDQIQTSAELRKLAAEAGAHAQAEIDRLSGQLMAALSKAKALEVATGTAFLQLPSLPAARVDSTQIFYDEPSKARIMAQANRIAVQMIQGDSSTLPPEIARVSALRNDLISALGQIQGQRRMEQRERHRQARAAKAGYGVGAPSGLTIPRTADNKAPQRWAPSGGMVS